MDVMSAMRTVPSALIRRPLFGAALTIMALLAAGLATATPATGAVRPGRASFSAVSCKGSSWCMAVGSYTSRSGQHHALAEVWNGKTWRVLKDPPGRAPNSLSCSAAWFCMANGGPTGAQTWNGKTWREMKSPPGGLSGISCGSRSTCMVIYRGVVQSWNGKRWRIWTQATSVCGGPPGYPCGLASVSCGSASNCVGVGTQTISQEPVQDTVGVAWNGTSWTHTSPPGYGNPSAANAVSCAGNFCMDVGGGYADVDGGNVASAGTWNATTQTWKDVSPTLPVFCKGAFKTCSWAHIISCGSAANCMTFGIDGNLAWNGRTWTPAPSVSAGKGSNLRTVSCGGGSCVAVGYQTVAGAQQTLAELWNGRTWRILKTPSLP